MEIRHLLPTDDRIAISKIYEKSWKHAYQGIIPQSFLDSVPEGSWASNIDDPRQTALICLENGRMVGTGSIGPSRTKSLPGWGEIISIYFLPEYMGKGYGKKLMEAAVSHLQHQGYDHIFLWVLAENTRARRFYERFGFSPTTDVQTITIDGKSLEEVRYVWHA